MKYIIPMLAALTLAGCSSGNDAAQQAEIEKLRAETEKAKAEAAALKRQNDLYAGEAAELQAKAARDRAATDAMDAERERAVAEARKRTMDHARSGKGPMFTIE